MVNTYISGASVICHRSSIQGIIEKEVTDIIADNYFSL